MADAPHQRKRLLLACTALIATLLSTAGLLRWDWIKLFVEFDVGPVLGVAPEMGLQEVDDRFGIIVTNQTFPGHTLRVVGLPWYIDYTFQTGGIPTGAQKAMKVRTGATARSSGVAAAARARPGSYWLIGNEPNAPGQDDVSPESYAESLHDYVALIKGADPTAKIVAPEVLNFDRTCTGCPGFPAGREWVEGFLRAYREAYGEFPPIDVWSLHTYDLNWERLPLGDPLAELSELRAFRSFLDTLPQASDRPIWLTEFSVMWGYPGIQWDDSTGDPLASPDGALDFDHLQVYLASMTQALKANAGALRLERWFLFATHPHTEDWATAPGGITLVQGTGPHARLNALGELYRSLAQGRP